MYNPQTCAAALLLMLLSMVCWDSWANTQKLYTGWRFELLLGLDALGLASISLAPVSG
jgi:glucose uptake protein